MARVQFGSIVTEINGSVGGQTFQKSRFGHTVKNKNIMCTPNSVAQNASKVILSRVARAWSGLTVFQRSAYDTYADVFPSYPSSGSLVAISGYNLFCKYNYYRVASGDSPLLDAALIQELYTDADIIFEVDGSDGMFITIADTSVLTLGYDLYVSPPLKQSVNFNSGKLRYLFSGIYEQVTAEAVAAEYVALFGRLPNVNDTILYQVVLRGTTFPQLAVLPQVVTIVGAS